MKTALQEKSENWLLLKSLLAVVLVAAAGLILMRHAAPVEKEKKFFGGGVSLLLADSEEDIRQFRRWAELNDPSRVFGYNSAGLFTRSVARKQTLTLPAVRGGLSGVPESSLYQQSQLVSPAFKLEKKTLRSEKLAAVVPAEKRPFLSAGLPVFDENGKIAVRLSDTPSTNMIDALLIKSSSKKVGCEFSVIKSSGDKKFDGSVLRELEKITAGGKAFSGMLAVWPESEGERR